MNYQHHFSTRQFYTLDVFTEQIFGGNPLAVFPEAEGLSDEKMQTIAQELNLSETVFVLPTEQADCDYKLRIFTPRAEIPFAGHPTVGTAYLLAHLGLIQPLTNKVNFQEGVGKVPVVIDWAENTVKNTALRVAQFPEFSPLPESLSQPLECVELFSSLLNLNPADLPPNLLPEVISCGLPFLYLPLKNLDALNRCSLNLSVWQQCLEHTDAAHVYPFVVTGEYTIYARMFAPELGITEDPATGSAATSLAGYLYKYFPRKKPTEIWQIHQGIQMGRPSQLTLQITANNRKISRISVGGASVLVSTGRMSVSAMLGH